MQGMVQGSVQAVVAVAHVWYLRAERILGGISLAPTITLPMRPRIYWNIWLFCDPTLGNNILSRLHRIYIVGYNVTHHLSSVFDWWSYLFTTWRRKVGVLDRAHGPQNIAPSRCKAVWGLKLRLVMLRLDSRVLPIARLSSQCLLKELRGCIWWVPEHIVTLCKYLLILRIWWPDDLTWLVMVGGALEERWKEFYVHTWLRVDILSQIGTALLGRGTWPQASLQLLCNTWAALPSTAFFCRQPTTSDALFPEKGRRSAGVRTRGLRAWNSLKGATHDSLT